LFEISSNAKFSHVLGENLRDKLDKSLNLLLASFTELRFAKPEKKKGSPSRNVLLDRSSCCRLFRILDNVDGT
jgi:hypothetical protein